MKIDVTEEKKNPFLKRIDLMLMVDHTGSATPKEEELKKEIAKKFKSGPDHVEVVYIFTQAGIAKSKVKSRIWVGKAPVKPKKEKPKPKEEAKPEEAPKEEEKLEEKPEEKKVEEKPKEEPKVEKKEEKKPEVKKEEPKKEQPKPGEKPKEVPKPKEKKEGEKK